MRYVHWTLNLQEAEIVAGLLRAEGMPAWVLNKGQIAVYWFHILALGGFRVYVPEACIAQAMDVMTRWRADGYRLDDDELEMACPRCGSTRHQADTIRQAWALVLLLVAAGIALWWPKRWLRCDNRGHRWKLHAASVAQIPYP